MKFFDKIKSLFSKNVKNKNQNTAELVMPHKQSKNTYLLGTKLIVPEGFVFIFSTHGKIFDIVKEGEIVISAATLPLISKKTKLFRANKDGTQKDRFSAIGYFIPLNPTAVFECSVNGKIPVYNAEGYKTDWIKFDFIFSVKNNNPAVFLKFLLDYFAVLRIGEANKILKSYASEEMTEIVSKMRFVPVGNIILSDEKVNQISVFFKEKIEKTGLTITEFKILNIKTKNLTQKTAEKKPTATVPEIETAEKAETLNNNKSSEELNDNEEDELKPLIFKTKKDKDYSDDFIFDDENVLQKDNTNYNNIGHTKTDDELTVIKTKAEPDRFVNLNITESSVCRHCGKELVKEAQFCHHCGKPNAM